MISNLKYAVRIVLSCISVLFISGFIAPNLEDKFIKQLNSPYLNQISVNPVFNGRLVFKSSSKDTIAEMTYIEYKKTLYSMEEQRKKAESRHDVIMSILFLRMELNLMETYQKDSFRELSLEKFNHSLLIHDEKGKILLALEKARLFIQSGINPI